VNLLTFGRAVRVGALAAATAAFFLVPATESAASAATKPQPHTGTRAVEPAPGAGVLAGAERLGALVSTIQLSGAVALAPRDQTALANFIAAATDPSSPSYGHYLAEGQYARTFGPSPAAIAAVESYLRAGSLTLTGVSGDGLLVNFTGRTSAVEATFGTTIERYRLADGTIGFGTTSAVRLPASLAPEVEGVVGLDDLVHLTARPLHAVGKSVTHAAVTASEPAGAPHACGGATSQEQYGGITDDQIAHSYGVDGLYSAGDFARGETVDVFELEPFFMSDVAAFDECYFGNSHTNQVKVIPVDGGAGTGEGSGEAALDVENISAFAPDANINVYEAPNTTIGSLDTYDSMVVADNARAISTSWGLCETAFQMGAPGTLQIENAIFMEAAAQGESIFAAAGDDGSDDCSPGPTKFPQYLSVDDPGSDPYVVSAGGTTFLNTAEPPSEIVWNDGGGGGASGGGISATWAMPAWQEDSGVPGVTNNLYIQRSEYQFCSNDSTGTPSDAHPAGYPTTLEAGILCREVPDVTALADEYTGITVYYGGWTTIGGTSSAAPMWAAIDAEMSGSSYCTGQAHGVGFISPLLYRVAANPTSYKEAFNDITVGNNDNMDVGTDLPGGSTTYRAGSGFDMASGLGSPRVTGPTGGPGLAELICGAAKTTARASVTKISPQFGSSAGGTTFSITGSNFGSTPGTVQFGDIRLGHFAIKSWTCTSSSCTITAATPAAYLAEGPGGPAGGEALVTVIPAAGTSGPSLPGASSTFHYLAPPSNAPIVDFVSPPVGASGGGTKVTIIGSGFTAGGGAPTVSVDGNSATAVHVVSDSELTAVTPVESAGGCQAGSGLAATGACQAEVTVTSKAGTSPEATIRAAYQGGVTVGANGVFTPPATCDCEVVPATTEFDYAARAAIDAITPRYGNANGGTVETIQGSGFNYLTYEWTNFGSPTSSYSQDIDLVSITEDAVQVVEFGAPNPPGPSPQPSAVSVQTLGGGLAQNSASTPFAYAGVPKVTALSSTHGSTEGGQVLVITGSGLEDASSVEFRSFQAPSVPDSVIYLPAPTSSTSATKLKIETPSDLPTETYVVVCSTSGCSPASSDLTYIFDYPGQPVVTSSTPRSGQARGGTAVTIDGSLLTGVEAVYFGTAPALSFSNGAGGQPTGDSTRVTALAPPGLAGTTVDIKVLTYGSSLPSNPDAHATFTYSKGTASAPSPVVVRPGGGTATVSWQVPLTNGGFALTGYTVTATSPRHSPIIVKNISLTVLRYTFPYLEPGVPWNFSVAAINSAGTGAAASAPTPTIIGPGDTGYLVATADGSVFGYGGLATEGGGAPLSSVVGVAGTPDGLGFDLVSSNGTVHAFGNAPYFGSAAPKGARIVAIAMAPGDHGYWLVSNTGAVYAYGKAGYHGGLTKVTNVVGIAPTYNGDGYWLDESNGAVQGFGNARFQGSMEGKHLNKPIVGIVADPSTAGYWLVGGDGGVFSFGAPYYGSMIGKHLNEGATGLASTPDGRGYWIVAADGGVFTFGSAAYEGNALHNEHSAATGIASEL
jgi:hypothetical protein